MLHEQGMEEVRNHLQAAGILLRKMRTPFLSYLVEMSTEEVTAIMDGSRPANPLAIPPQRDNVLTVAIEYVLEDLGR